MLEFYSYSLYGFLIPQISYHFFPSESDLLPYLMAFTILAVGFMARPFGAILYGYVGDTQGRHVALLNTLLVMAISTLIIVFIPTYQQIGVSAALLLIFARIAQSIALGGEFTGILVFLSEYYHTSRHKALITALCCSSNIIGWFLGFGVSIVCINPQLPDYAWRIPFFLGFVLLLVGVYLRRRLSNTMIMIQALKKNSIIISPLRHLFAHHKFNIMQGFGIGLVIGVTFYSQFVFQNTFMRVVLHLPASFANMLTAVGMLCLILSLPLFGYLSDKRGRLYPLKTALYFVIIFSFPIFYLLSTNIVIYMLLAQCMAGVILAGFMVPALLTLPLLFSPIIRYTGASLSFGIGMSVLGMLTPILSLSLLPANNSLAIMFLWHLLSCIIGWLTLRKIKKPAVTGYEILKSA